MRFAESQFTLNEAQSDGATLRQHLEAVRKQTGENPRELDELLANRCPDLLEPVWAMFIELNGSRGSNGFSISPISYTEMLAWSAMTGQHPTHFEVKAIKAVDVAYINSQAKQAKKTNKQPA